METVSSVEFQRLKQRDRVALHPSQLPASTLTAIAQAEVPSEHAHLDDLLPD